MFLDDRLCHDADALQLIVQHALDAAAIKQVAEASKAAAASFINSEDTDNESNDDDDSDSSENDTDTDDSETTGITKRKNKSSKKKHNKLAPIAAVQNSRNSLLPAVTTFNVDMKRLGLSPYDIIRIPAILNKLRYVHARIRMSCSCVYIT
jgi:hypothetical protein